MIRKESDYGKKKNHYGCDPGVDDAIALAYAAAHPEAFELLAVTSVTGNQTIDKVTRNALDLVSLYRLSIPVARGAETPLLRDPRRHLTITVPMVWETWKSPDLRRM